MKSVCPRTQDLTAVKQQTIAARNSRKAYGQHGQSKSRELQSRRPFISGRDAHMASNRMRVLIVDDDIFFRDSLSWILAGCGYKVRSADGASAALSEIRQEIPDVLLCDLYLPGLSGFELLSAVRHRFPTIHVIAMSGASVGRGVPHGVAADALYDKGCGVNALKEVIAAARRMATVRAPPGC